MPFSQRSMQYYTCFEGRMDSGTPTKNHPLSQTTAVSNSNDEKIIEVLKTKNDVAVLQNTMSKLNLSPTIRDYFCECVLDRKKNKQFVDDIANKLKISIGADRSQSILDKLNKITDQNDKSIERSKMTEFLKLIVQGQFKKASQICIEYFEPESQIKNYLKEMQNVYELSKKLFEFVFKNTSKYKVNDSNLKFENPSQSLEAIQHQLTFRYDQLGQFVEAFEKSEKIMERVKYPNSNPKFSIKINLWIHTLDSINKQTKSYEIVKESYQNIMTQYYSTKKIDKSKIYFDTQQWQTELKKFESIIVAMISDSRLKGSPSKASMSPKQSKINDMQKQIEEYQKKIVQCSDIIASQKEQLAILKSNQYSKSSGFNLEKQRLMRGKNFTNQIEVNKQLNQQKNEIQFWKNKKQTLDKELENKQKELTNQKQYLKKIQEDSKTKTNKNIVLEREKKKVQEELTSANQKVVTVQQTNQQLSSEITKLEKNIKQFENKESKFLSQISSLKSSLGDRDAKIVSLQDLHRKAKLNSESQQISELKIQLKNESQNLAQEKKNQIKMMADSQKLQKQVLKLEEEVLQNKQYYENTLTQMECQRQKEAQNHSTEKQIFQTLLKSVQKQKDELSQQVVSLQSINESLREKMEQDSRTKQQVSDTRNKLSKAIEELRSQLKEQQEKEDDLEQQLQAAKEAIQFVNNEKQKLTQSFQEKQTLVASLERSLEEKETILSQKELMHQKQEQKLQQLQQSLSKGEQTQSKLKEEYERNIAEIKQESERRLQLKDDKIDQMGQQIKILTEQHKEENKKIEKMQKEMIERADQQSRKNTNLTEKITLLEEDKKKLEESERALKKQIDDLIQKQKNQSNLELSSVSKLHLSLYQSKLHQSETLKLDPITLCVIDRFFQGYVLQDRYQDKSFIISSVQSLMGKKVIGTNLIYTFDPRNNASFHEYIDNKSNLLCIVKSVNGVFMAAYYSGTYMEKTVMNEPSLLLSLKDKQVFKLNAPKDKLVPRGMVYDKYYTIFGNSELRLKLSDREIYSNFSVNNAYFNNREFTVGTLLGEGNNRQTKLESMEVYQIIFMEEEKKIEQASQ